MEQSEKQVVQLLQSQNRRLMLQNGLLLMVVILVGCLFFLWNDSTSQLEPQMEETLERVQEFSMSMNEITRQLNDAKVVENLQSVIKDVQIVVNNMDSISTQLAGIDLTAQIEELSAVVKSTGEALSGAAQGIAEVDLEGLSQAIQDLETFISPLAALAGVDG
ncbi:MAG TPA: hypothetical protein IAC91_00115 [Candidatus Faecimorpha stercoravium]|nr:hypothetical protein [Candidatus Faecimorpha stercoravium]